jgi:hypothetical protein
MMKYALSIVVVVAIAIPALVIFSCGGDGLPSAPACPTPTPIAVASTAAETAPDDAAFAAYRVAIGAGIKQITDLREGFRKQYPTDTFFRDKAFRPDFAHYADNSICTAQQLLATKFPAPATTQGAQIDNTKLNNALEGFISTMQDGRDAVASRNVSEYHRWYAVIGGEVQAIKEAAVGQ